jgi:multidrug efflux pump subunit AcrB
MGLSVSLLSIMGMLALSGVVVNDSLVMVDYVNQREAEGYSRREAVMAAGSARFRAILLTSLTTFCGLFPMILEKSMQAQFLIPMAVSLGFGILFATFITLFLVPCVYLIVTDIGALFVQQAAGPAPAPALATAGAGPRRSLADDLED